MSLDRRILIADDDADLRAGFADLVDGLGVEVLEAENGETALAIVQRERLDLAVLDMHMPDLTGMDVLEGIRALHFDLPCIFCSGQAEDGVLEMARQRGANAVFRKPVEPLVLRGEMLRLLGIRLGDR